MNVDSSGDGTEGFDTKWGIRNLEQLEAIQAPKKKEIENSNRYYSKTFALQIFLQNKKDCPGEEKNWRKARGLGY